MPDTTPDTGSPHAWPIALGLVAPAIAMSLTEVTARSVWQYGMGGLAIPLGAALALLFVVLAIRPAMQRAEVHSMAHWLAWRTAAWLRRPFAVLALLVDLTLLSLLVQTLQMLTGLLLPFEASTGLILTLLLCAGVFALPQTLLHHYVVPLAVLALVALLMLAAMGAQLGFVTSIDWAQLAARTPTWFDSTTMGFTFALATLMAPALYSYGARASLPRLARAGVPMTALLLGALTAYIAARGIAGADSALLREAPALLPGLLSQVLAAPLYTLWIASLAAGTLAAVWVILGSVAQGIFVDLLRLETEAQAQYLPRALLAMGALLAAQLIATGDSTMARAAIAGTSFAAGRLALPLLYSARRSAKPVALVVAGVLGAIVWAAAVAQQSPGDPALWAAAAAAIYVTLDWIVSALRGKPPAHK